MALNHSCVDVLLQLLIHPELIFAEGQDPGLLRKLFLMRDSQSHALFNLQAEYVWIGGQGDDLRSKGRTFDSAPSSIDELPVWNFDGSSTAQAEGHDSEVLLQYVPPQACRSALWCMMP